jgi:hypothetical protein
MARALPPHRISPTKVPACAGMTAIGSGALHRTPHNVVICCHRPANTGPRRPENPTERGQMWSFVAMASHMYRTVTIS